MTKLQDLPEQELANLLGLPLDKARTWLEVARSVSEDPPWLEDWFGDFESATSLRRSSVRELMELPVEEVKRLKKTGEFYRRYPYFKRKAPTDAKTRLRYLRDLLGDEVEFEARYPAAYELLFERSRAISGLPLPSFDVRVLRNDPQVSVLPAGWFQDWKRHQDSGDAFSRTFVRRAPGDKKIDQSAAALDPGYMRGVLLAILAREEYAERVATELHNESVHEELGAPARSPVRLTDLRLAAASEIEDPRALKRALEPLLYSLERPITTNGVLRWKWEQLTGEDEKRGHRPEGEDAKILMVSFAAAALLLFLDADMPYLEDANQLQLATHIASLAEIVQKLVEFLDKRAADLEKVLANRPLGKPPTYNDGDFYAALVEYRMDFKKVSDLLDDFGITRYKSTPSKVGGKQGTKQWKGNLEGKLRRGVRFEKERYPSAAAVLENQDKPRIRDKARLAYSTYVEECYRTLRDHLPWPEQWDPSWHKVGKAIRVDVSTDPGLEVTKAYIQLGSCLKRRLNPFPTRSDLDY